MAAAWRRRPVAGSRYPEIPRILLDLTAQFRGFRRLNRHTLDGIYSLVGRRSVVMAMEDRLAMAMLGQMFRKSMDLRAAVTTEAEALASVRRHRPDLLFCTDRLETGNILSCCRSAREAMPQLAVLMVVSQQGLEQTSLARELAKPEFFVEALVLERDLGGEEAPLQAAFQAVVLGERYRSPSLQALNGTNRPHQPNQEQGALGLTAREEQVLGLMVRGLQDRQIGEALGLSYETARTYVKAVRRKLGGGSRFVAAARFRGS